MKHAHKTHHTDRAGCINTHKQKCACNIAILMNYILYTHICMHMKSSLMKRTNGRFREKNQKSRNFVFLLQFQKTERYIFSFFFLFIPLSYNTCLMRPPQSFQFSLLPPSSLPQIHALYFSSEKNTPPPVTSNEQGITR